MSKDLRQFLRKVKQAGPEYYVEVKRPLKPELEKDVLQIKLAREGRFPVIYCPKIKGSKFPLVSNLLGSYELLALALDLDPKAAKRLEAEAFQEYRKREGKTKKVKVIPASEAPVKEVIMRGKDVDLGILPINKHAELNSTKYITIGNLICKNPDNGIPNVGVYRHEVKGKDRLGAVFSPTHHASYHARRYAELGKPMEVAIFIGHHPAVLLGSQFMGPPDLNELEITGGFLGEPLRVTPAETVDLPVPADAEIVLEGTIDPRNMDSDGPLAEWTGYYGAKQKCYVVQITCITMRKDAIYHDLAPSQREHNMGGVLGCTSVAYDAVKSVVPSVKDVYLPFSGRHLMIGYISITKRVPGEGKRAALAAACMDAMRIAVVVDDDIDVYNEEEVLWAIATRTTPDKDVIILPGILSSPLNPTSYDESRQKRGPMNTKMIIDATKPVELPFPTRVTPPKDLWESMKLEDYLSSAD